MKIAISIPARYGSTRFPGKPLAMIAGRSMLSRVVEVAHKAAAQQSTHDIDIFVATEDQRIADHAATLNVPCVMTSDDCKTGSDRAREAVIKRGQKPDFVINLQGDAPLTPPEIIGQMIDAITPQTQVITPVHQLSWEALDQLRHHKETTPFSGTTAILNPQGDAHWFSKNIIPAIRKEDRTQAQSPVYQHIGLYGYSTDILEAFCTWPEGHYEALEGLEQLRFIENNITIQCVKITTPVHAGIDSPEDITRAEEILAS